MVAPGYARLKARSTLRPAKFKFSSRKEHCTMSTSIAELNSRFGIPHGAKIVEGNGGLPKIQITAPAATAEMYLHGAHITAWRPTGCDEVFFLSPHSLYQDGVAIRGGVPICFPWFGAKGDDPQAPAPGVCGPQSW